MAHRSGWRRLVLIVVLMLVALPAMAADEHPRTWHLAWGSDSRTIVRLASRGALGLATLFASPSG
jgi:hypothetical protein